MPTTLKTARGIYVIASARPLERNADAVVLTLSLERADGIEKVALRCRIATSLIGATDSPEKLIERIAAWLEREFEQTREAALKSIRTERKLLEISFDATHPGPFA
ncbi:hypothetical protein [Candidatus Binatus sp.]|uniref:hypothetical protein n=1 Tax=Candidatus Binatus sp. TaxID=2811406 RepID=UPI003C70224D